MTLHRSFFNHAAAGMLVALSLSGVAKADAPLSAPTDKTETAATVQTDKPWSTGSLILAGLVGAVIMGSAIGVTENRGLTGDHEVPPPRRPRHPM